MNEELQNKLVEVITAIQSATEKAGDFAIEQMPDVVHQYLMWGIFDGLAYSVFFMALAFVSGFIFYKALNTKERVAGYLGIMQRPAGNEMLIWTMLPSCIFSIFIGMVKFDPMPLIAPKVWLIKELALMVR